MPGDIIIPDVEIFQDGDWQGDTYTTADLDEIVRNYYEHRDLIEPPVKIGHEEDQSLLDNSGIPAVGYVRALRRRGHKLFADLSQIFPQIADLVEARAYRKVSAELYPPDKPPEGVPMKGWGLKAVSLLGGRLPYIKTLADLPKPVRRLSERLRRHSPRMVHLQSSRRVWHNTAARTVVCFSEVRQMADSTLRDAAVGAIKASHPDLSDDFLASLSDEQLAMLAAADTTGGASGGGEGEAQMQDMPSREQMIADLVALGEDQAALEAMTDEDLMRLWQEKKGATMAEPNRASTAVPAPLEVDDEVEPRGAVLPRRAPKKVTTTQQFSEADLERIVTRVANRIIAPLRQDVQRQRAVHQAREREERHGLIRTFCERLVKEGRLSPAQVENGKDGKPVGPVAKALHAADAVRKFSDGKTALQLQMEALEALPARRFSEQVQDPVTNAAGQLAPERRDYLLGLTGAGKRVLSREQQSKDNARLFAEAMAGVMKQVSSNGRTG
jgi:hypothetical protein